MQSRVIILEKKDKNYSRNGHFHYVIASAGLHWRIFELLMKGWGCKAGKISNAKFMRCNGGYNYGSIRLVEFCRSCDFNMEIVRNKIKTTESENKSLQKPPLNTAGSSSIPFILARKTKLLIT